MPFEGFGCVSSENEWRWADPMGQQRRIRSDELRSALAGGIIAPNTPVWRTGWKEWVSASEVPELATSALSSANGVVPNIPPPPLFMVAVQHSYEDTGVAPPPPPAAPRPRRGIRSLPRPPRMSPWRSRVAAPPFSRPQRRPPDPSPTLLQPSWLRRSPPRGHRTPCPHPRRRSIHRAPRQRRVHSLQPSSQRAFERLRAPLPFPPRRNARYHPGRGRRFLVWRYPRQIPRQDKG
jgi:hypothetical protein